jgi:hypothetical protein
MAGRDQRYDGVDGRCRQPDRSERAEGWPACVLQEAGAVLILSHDIITIAAEWLIYLAPGLPFAWWFFWAERSSYNPGRFKGGPTFTQYAGYVGGVVFWPVLVWAFGCALPKAWRTERRRRLFGETPLRGLRWVRWAFDSTTQVSGKGSE